MQAAARTFLALTASVVAFRLVAGALDAAPVPSASEADPAGLDFFEKRIRPVLAGHCYKCHSAASDKLKGGLRLDTREGLLKGGDSGKPAIVPGDAESSRLIQAIRYSDPDLQMPPENKKLSTEQITDLEAWVKLGAPDPRTESIPNRKSQVPDPKHWAFQPPRPHPIPAVKNRSWPQTAIDHFILAKLEAQRLQPSPPADKRTLIRRATYDLTGLPPTAEEVAAFLADKSPRAFATVVDRLLASPRYGERWGRHWLDVARYSDTKGYVYDREEKRFVHSETYRDWVIRALNEDMPYDQFLRLQIAADQLLQTRSAECGVRNEDLAAMGFLTLGRRFLGVVHDIIDDRLDVVMRGTQALTIGCARCHDHKFDPIPTQDYYSLYGVFYNSAERTLPLVPVPERTRDYLAYEEELLKRVAKLEQTFQKKRAELTDRLRARAADYLAAVLDADKLPTEEFYTIMGADDLNPVIVRQWQAHLYQARKDVHPVFALWNALAALPEKDFAAKAAAVLKQFELSATETATDGASNAPPADTETTGARRVNRLVARAFAGAPPSSMREVAERYGKLLTDADRLWREWLKQPTTANAQSTTERLPDPDQEAIRQVLYGPDSPAHVPDGALVDIEWFFDEGTRVELARLQAEIERWIINAPGAPPHAVILQDRPNPKNARVFKRGNPANKGEEVPRQFLQVLCPTERKPFTLGSGRLELAQAIASTNNPLTARVLVNRVWLHHFGAGLVRTPSDFGTRSEPPTHPELLDWLAWRFMADGWSIKKLHRLIMLSAVYQQASDAEALKRSTVEARGGSTVGPRFNDSTVQRFNGRNDTSRGRQAGPRVAPAVAATVDPQNRLLWRFNRQRLDFEGMRDSLLAVSGELDLTAGGKAVELFKSPAAPRRTIYGFLDRQFVPGVYRVFDFANPDLHTPQRSDTTVPQQALFFMNSPFLTERARALARRPEVRGIDALAERVRRLYRLAYQREPTARQVATGVRFLETAQTEPTPEPPKPRATPWQYGFGEYDEGSDRLKAFHPLPNFTGEAWQGGPEWPDGKLGWVQLKADGGHAGNDLAHAAVRRWTAPRDGTVWITGVISHAHKEGDGIRARVVSSRTGQLRSWKLHNGHAEGNFAGVEVKKDDTLDFVVDLLAGLNSDMFTWAPVITADDTPVASAEAQATRVWDAKKDFGGPPPAPPVPLDAWEKYAQVLLLANEFVFVD
ncbi:MAG: PSD1 domain-containing protein [Verrucomicrobia bacterium]|nr:PSD1 domain-containing protein [Verrucomicrobiota bacterium]